MAGAHPLTPGPAPAAIPVAAGAPSATRPRAMGVLGAIGLGAIALALAGQGPCAAQPAPATAPVIVTGKRPIADCSKAASGQIDMACLNAALAKTAARARPRPVAPTAFDIVGNGQPDKVGTFSFTGTSEMLGSNFGKSAFPQRPAPPVYHAPPLSPPPTRPR